MIMSDFKELANCSAYSKKRYSKKVIELRFASLSKGRRPGILQIRDVLKMNLFTDNTFSKNSSLQLRFPEFLYNRIDMFIAVYIIIFLQVIYRRREFPF